MFQVSVVAVGVEAASVVRTAALEDAGLLDGSEGRQREKLQR